MVDFVMLTVLSILWALSWSAPCSSAVKRWLS